MEASAAASLAGGLVVRALWFTVAAVVALAGLDYALARRRIATQMNSPYLQKMGTCLTEHRAGLLVFFTCLDSGQYQLRRLSRSQQRWVALTTRWALPITSNAAEHVFRCLRRYTNNMDHFVTSEATQRFFDLFLRVSGARIPPDAEIDHFIPQGIGDLYTDFVGIGCARPVIFCFATGQVQNL